MKKKFLVDTNFFIQAHRVSYPLDVVPSFWNKIKNLADKDKIISIDKVKNEIYQNEDDLKNWCQSNLKEDFWRDTSVVSIEYSNIANWAVKQRNRYTPNAINEFLDSENADAFLIAYALADRDTRIVVTYEVSNKKKSIIKIPDVCLEFEISYLNPITMFRELNESF
jgi:D-serine dehydratase